MGDPQWRRVKLIVTGWVDMGGRLIGSDDSSNLSFMIPILSTEFSAIIDGQPAEGLETDSPTHMDMVVICTGFSHFETEDGNNTEE